MMTGPPRDPEFDAVVAFHGHLCLDIAMGYRVAKAAMRELSCERPRDEELVAIVENDSCSVDAVQVVTGCTFGKGNLMYRPYGKAGYTFVERRTGRAVRVYCHFWERFDTGEGREFAALMNRVLGGTAPVDEIERFENTMRDISLRILASPEDELLTVVPSRTPPPASARIFASSACDRCGEWTMETRLVTAGSTRLCPPCQASAG